MKVFLSWSGETSHQIALALREWLPQVIQALVPYVSSEDIDKGARWSTDIAKELEASVFGILCVTPGNVEAPWLNFEAGALSKILDRSRVTPLLAGMKLSELRGPLVQFQATLINEEDMKRLVKTLNDQCGDSQLDNERLSNAFEKWWPDLKRRLGEVKMDGPASTAAIGPQPNILEEILETVRAQQRQVSELFGRLERISDDRRAQSNLEHHEARARRFLYEEALRKGKEGTTILLSRQDGREGFDVELEGKDMHAVSFLRDPGHVKRFLDELDLSIPRAVEKAIKVGKGPISLVEETPLALNVVYQILEGLKDETR